jgi:hypothetical protein
MTWVEGSTVASNLTMHPHVREHCWPHDFVNDGELIGDETEGRDTTVTDAFDVATRPFVNALLVDVTTGFNRNLIF